jgi:sugar phosphate isomerase/epimerase
VLCFYCSAYNPSRTGKTVLIACSTASFPQESLDSALRRIAWAGFGAVEIDLRQGEPEASHLRTRLRDEGLETAAIHAGTAPAVAGEAGLAEWGRIGRIAALARELDGAPIVLAAGDTGDLRQLREGLSLLDRALGGFPVDVCLVNGFGTLLSNSEAMNELWRSGLPARMRLALDPAQAELAGWDPLDLSRLPVPPTHIYWNDLRDGRSLPPGEGDLPLFALAEALLASDPPPRSLTVTLENADAWRVEPLAREIYRQTVVQFEKGDAD